MSNKPEFIELPWGAHVRPETVAYVEHFEGNNEVILHFVGGGFVIRYAPVEGYGDAVATAKEWADSIKRKLGILK